MKMFVDHSRSTTGGSRMLIGGTQKLGGWLRLAITAAFFCLLCCPTSAQELAPPDTANPIQSPDPVIIIGGVIGAGGYPWQGESISPNPLESLGPEFRSSDLALVTYQLYESHWYDRIMFWANKSRRLKPNPQTLNFISSVGIKALLLLPAGRGPDPSAMMRAANLTPIPSQSAWNATEPQIFELHNLKLGVLHCAQRIFTDKPVFKEKGDALLVDWETAVKRAKKAVGPEGRLMAFLPQAADNDRLFTRERQMIARRAIDLGAHAVIGTGGGATQEIEEYKNGLIAYSLGTILRPPDSARRSRGSDGILLRLTLPQDQKIKYEIIPISADETCRPALRAAKSDGGLIHDDKTHLDSETLADQLLYARVTASSEDGKKEDLSTWAPLVNEPSSFLDDRLEIFWHKFKAWLCGRHALESVHEGYRGAQAAVGIGGIASRGEFRRLMVFDPGHNQSLSAAFVKIAGGDQLRVVYGVSDETVKENADPPGPQTLLVSAGQKALLERSVPCAAGWQTVSVDTANLAGRETEFTVELKRPGHKSFPVAVDLVLVRSPETLAALEQKPFAFEEHLREAVVVDHGEEGLDRECLSLDETFRFMRGAKQKFEEHGPFGEGVLYHRWYCGDQIWDGVAATLQKSGNELRRAVWLHPISAARRYLTYGPLTLRRQITGYYGLTNMALTKSKAPMYFSIYLGDRRIFKKKLSNPAGWQSFNAPIPQALRGQTEKISFVVEAQPKKHVWRHFCFNAWMN